MNNFNSPTNFETLSTLPGYRPLAGRCVIRVDSMMDHVGSIIVPDCSQALRVDQQNQNKAYTGIVLHVTPRKSPKGATIDPGFSVGDHVFVMLYGKDLGRPVINTLNAAVYAVHPCEGKPEDCKWRPVEI